MPHYGLIDATQMIEEDVALIRARLHLHDGKRLLQEGLSAAGLVALYDALLFGMRHFIVEAAGCKRKIDSTNNDDLWDPAVLYYELAKLSIFDDPCAFNRLSLIVERVLWQESFSFDADAVLADVEKMLTKLGVVRFNEATLLSKVQGVRWLVK